MFGGTVIDLSVGWTLLTTQQRIDGIVVDGKPSNRGDLLVYCALFPKRCEALRPYLKGGEDSLNQLVVSLARLQPVGSSTDSSDWLEAITGTTRTRRSRCSFTARANAAAGDSLGAGFPLAPVRWSISPNLAQRFGGWDLAPWYQYLSYASSIGQAHVAGLRISCRIAPTWTVWVSGSAQWDLLADPTSPTPDTAEHHPVASRAAWPWGSALASEQLAQALDRKTAQARRCANADRSTRDDDVSRPARVHFLDVGDLAGAVADDAGLDGVQGRGPGLVD